MVFLCFFLACHFGARPPDALWIAVVLLLFGRGKISDLMGDVAQGIKSFKKGLQDDEKTAEKPEPVKSIDHSATTSAQTRSDVGSKA